MTKKNYSENREEQILEATTQLEQFVKVASQFVLILQNLEETNESTQR
jgi:hypothetical protein